MFTQVRDELNAEIEEIRSQGLFKPERVIVTPQQATVKVSDGSEVLNLCANNYLGLADDPRVVAAAKAGAGPLGLRHGERAVHLRHPGGAQGAGAHGSPSSFGRRTRSCIPRASTRTGVCSRRCSARTTPSSATS